MVSFTIVRVGVGVRGNFLFSIYIQYITRYKNQTRINKKKSCCVMHATNYIAFELTIERIKVH